MWWECSACGAHVERLRQPLRCQECGTAGVIFTVLDPDDVAEQTGSDWRQAWIASGLSWTRAHTETGPMTP